MLFLCLRDVFADAKLPTLNGGAKGHVPVNTFQPPERLPLKDT